MKRVVALVALGAALVLAVLGCGGSTSAFGHYRILLLGHDPDAARIFLWRPGSPVKPLTGPQIYGTSGGGGFFSGTTDGFWSPDGRSIAFEQDSPGGLAPPSPTIILMRSDGTHAKFLSGGDYTVSSTDNADLSGQPSWSPDGRQLVYERDTIINTDMETAQEFAIVDVPSGHERTFPAELATSDPVWGSAGIAYLSKSGLMLLNPATGRSRLVLRGFNGSFAASPRGVLAAVEPSQIVLLAASGRVLAKLPLPPAAGRVCAIAWSPRGKQIIAATANGSLGLSVGTVSTKHWQSLSPVPTWRNYKYDCAASWR